MLLQYARSGAGLVISAITLTSLGGCAGGRQAGGTAPAAAPPGGSSVAPAAAPRAAVTSNGVEKAGEADGHSANLGERTDAAAAAPTLASLGWFLGNWVVDATTEDWVSEAGTYYGVSFGPKLQHFEVMIIDDGDEQGVLDGKLRLIAMPGGKQKVEFPLAAATASSARFENPTHDFPKIINYAHSAAALVADLTGSGEAAQRYAYQSTQARPAPELEVADRAFAADTARAGAAGWVRHFAEDGVMFGRNRLQGHGAILKAITSLFEKAKLEWQPTHSSLAPDGVRGFTVGRYTLTDLASKEASYGSYVTLWRRDKSGWKVLFDVGRPEQHAVEAPKQPAP